MKVRRVVTGHTAEGRSTIASDTEVDSISAALMPGVEFYRLWGTDSTPTVPFVEPNHPHLSYFPPVGGFRFGLFTVPPQSVIPAAQPDMKEALREVEAKLPGFVSHIELGTGGIHTTDTVDFEYVVAGDIWLELDDGVEVHLSAGDTVVQNGTRHAWRNRSVEPCHMVVILIGAHRA
jgi:hypothetical protein